MAINPYEAQEGDEEAPEAEPVATVTKPPDMIHDQGTLSVRVGVVAHTESVWITLTHSGFGERGSDLLLQHHSTCQIDVPRALIPRLILELREALAKTPDVATDEEAQRDCPI